jgi:UrcA family protein
MDSTRFKYTVALAAALVLGSVAARADETEIAVRANDLNLATEAGQAELNKRVTLAADAVCGGRDVTRTTQDWIAFRACRGNALAKAAPQMKAVTLAQSKGTFQVGMTSDK